MEYKVINKFKDTDGVIYISGEPYPKDGDVPSEKRIKELSEVHQKYKKAFIEKVESDEEKAEREAKEAEEKAKVEEQEKEAIKTELESLGVSFHPNTGLEKLREKLEEAKANSKTEE